MTRETGSKRGRSDFLCPVYAVTEKKKKLCHIFFPLFLLYMKLSLA